MPEVQPSRRGPKASLSIEKIAVAALRLTDEEGLERLTMKRLAEVLGVGEMTLYGYVRTKNDIYDALTDLAYSEIELPQEGAWQTQLRELFVCVHDLLMRHPSVAYLDSVRPTTGIAALRIANHALGLLAEAGLNDNAAFAAHRALVTSAVGSAVFQASRATQAGKAGLRARQADVLLAAREMPHLARHVDRYMAETTPAQARSEFLYALDQLITGIPTGPQRQRSLLRERHPGEDEVEPG